MKRRYYLLKQIPVQFEYWIVLNIFISINEWLKHISKMSRPNNKVAVFGLVIVILSMTSSIESTYHVERESPCDCICRDSFMDTTYAHKPLCHVLSRFEKELLTVKQEIERRTVYIHDLAELKEIMEEQEDLVRNLQEQVEKLSAANVESELLPTPASLVMREDFMQGDATREKQRKDEDLANNVSTLILKVEEVENLTSKVQEELKSERRVRRHLEEDLNETRFSIKMLDDKLLNVTLPMDSRVTHVEEIVLSTLETMNKTLFEDHLKKLYYKVDGVVYRNETEKLDERLDQVEKDVMDVNNINMSLKITEELINLTGILINMNQTIMGKFSEDEARLGSLENQTAKFEELDEMQDLMIVLSNRTAKLDEIEGLQYRLSNLANYTEFLRRQSMDLWIDVQNVRNTTVELEKELHDQTARSNRTIETIQLEISGQIKTLTQELSSLTDEVLTDHESLTNLQKDMQMLSADVALSENKVLNMSRASEKKMEEINTKIENLSGLWDNSMSVLVTQIEDWKNSNSGSSYATEPSFEHFTQSKNTDEAEDGDEEIRPIRMRGKGPEENRCQLPPIDNENVLVTLEEDSDGVQTLVFGCRPIGQYALSDATMPVQCANGTWHGAFPTCTRLKNESEIEALQKALKSANPCRYADGDVPDVADCSYFFKCSDGFMHGREHCPAGLHFDVRTRRCERPASAQCGTALYMETKTLAELIPTIRIEPDNVDKPSGLMATGGSGHLIVYPKTSFNLHCLFPENRLGPPTWTAEHFSTGFSNSIHSRSRKHRTTVEFEAVTSNFSGIYSCQTPYNKKNSITIIVQAVTCPAFVVDADREKAMTYDGHPHGGERILTTTAQFLCEGGSKVTSRCLPNGTWSRPPPTIEECPPKQFAPKIWGCEVWKQSASDVLEVKYEDYRMGIRFNCPEGKRLVGGSSVACRNGNWEPRNVNPKCMDL